MAITHMFKSLGDGLSADVRQLRSLLRRMRLSADSTALGANFRKYGASFGTYDFDAFFDKAQEFYEEAVTSDDARYTVMPIADNRIVVDYDGDIRGIYTRKGKPIAFFCPDYAQAGYTSKQAELEDFRNRKTILFSQRRV